MIPRFEPPIGRRELIAAITPSVDDDVAAFEQAFAQTMGQRHAVAFPYGRTALIALLQCLGISGCEVICPAYTCIVVPNAIVYSGNRPVFVDSGKDANARLDLAEGALSPRTGALIATSIFGNPIDLDGLAALRARHPRVPVIQDCAHSFICEWRGVPVHREGVAAIFGLNISKIMTSIFGGMVTTDDERLVRDLRDFRDEKLSPSSLRKALLRLVYALAVVPAFWPPAFALTDRLRRAGLLDRFTRYYGEDTIDMPADYLSWMTNLEARVGRVQTGQLASMIAARRTYDDYYRAQLANLPGLVWLERPKGSSISHVTARVARRDAVRAEAACRGIELGHVIEYSVPELPAYRRLLMEARSFPVAKVLSETTINLPTSNMFEPEKAQQVVRVLRAVLQGAPQPPPLPVG